MTSSQVASIDFNAIEQPFRINDDGAGRYMLALYLPEQNIPTPGLFEPVKERGFFERVIDRAAGRVTIFVKFADAYNERDNFKPLVSLLEAEIAMVRYFTGLKDILVVFDREPATLELGKKLTETVVGISSHSFYSMGHSQYQELGEVFEAKMVGQDERSDELYFGFLITLDKNVLQSASIYGFLLSGNMCEKMRLEHVKLSIDNTKPNDENAEYQNFFARGVYPDGHEISLLRLHTGIWYSSATAVDHSSFITGFYHSLSETLSMNGTLTIGMQTLQDLSDSYLRILLITDFNYLCTSVGVIASAGEFNPSLKCVEEITHQSKYTWYIASGLQVSHKVDDDHDQPANVVRKIRHFY